MSKFFNGKSGYAKVLLSGVVVSSLLAVSQPAWTAFINDVDKSSNYAKEAIIALAERGIISGDQNGNFNPHNIITRSEMVKILVNVLGIDTTNVPLKPTFSDVPSTHWAYKYVEAAYREGIIKGLPDGSFGRNQELTREQMAAMLVRSMGLTDQMLNYSQDFESVNSFADHGKIANWAKGSVDFVLSAGLMKGTGSGVFSAKAGAERQQVAIVANRLLEGKEEIQKRAETIFAQVRVVLNGDTIDLGDRAFDEDGKIYVPVTFFEKMGAETEVDDGMNTARIERHLSTGAKKGISFSRENSGDGLKVIEDEAYVPLEVAVKALGADIQREGNSGTVFINDDETVKYPNLYNAINASMGFKGRFSSTGLITMKDVIPDSVMEISLDIDGAINGDDYRVGYEAISRIDGIPDAPEKIDVIKVGEKLYVKIAGIEEWIETQIEELQNSGLIPVADPSGVDNGSGLVKGDAYNLYTISRAGMAKVGKEAAVKYVLTLDKSGIKDKLPSADPEAYSNILKMLDSGMNISMEIYLNKEGHIVRESLNYGMKVVENGKDTDVAVMFDKVYSNIGEDIKITAPEMVSDLTLTDILKGSF
ncbi:S-layer homology domain-containing protein [Pseudoclostridium thermosuccinogenes]|uniref:S-layer homology domain-containing protein n=1 Tax=Clostridium thermosuccinogenes TaxID=84032 RepID=UPI000CCC61BB|nr:S-layer homology domain-containing protein [Pseudoclostridium thermosuccinogenes]PNT90920.1 hypothetical protein CDQ83_13890 [Pseudoclostridium thermosuccinogenes]